MSLIAFLLLLDFFQGGNSRSTESRGTDNKGPPDRRTFQSGTRAALPSSARAPIPSNSRTPIPNYRAQIPSARARPEGRAVTRQPQTPVNFGQGNF